MTPLHHYGGLWVRAQNFLIPDVGGQHWLTWGSQAREIHALASKKSALARQFGSICGRRPHENIPTGLVLREVFPI